MVDTKQADNSCTKDSKNFKNVTKIPERSIFGSLNALPQSKFQTLSQHRKLNKSITLAHLHIDQLLINNFLLVEFFVVG